MRDRCLDRLCTERALGPLLPTLSSVEQPFDALRATPTIVEGWTRTDGREHGPR